MASAIVIGGGPAGLMAAEVLSGAGLRVAVHDAMPTLGRKLLRAGIGGLNLTHSEAIDPFLSRYGAAQGQVSRWIAGFGPQQLRDWAQGLGIECFVGSSGRVFPRQMKAAPLLRAWLRRLAAQGVSFHTRQRWLGWDAAGQLRFAAPEGADPAASAPASIVILALGGGSWSRLGSDGAWMPWLAARGVDIAPLRPANCGFDVAWSDHLRQRFAGTPLKTVAACFGGQSRRGELLISCHGVEGGLIYALAAPLRDEIAHHGKAILHLDLVPDRPLESLAADLARPRGRDSLANHLRRRTGIEGAKAALLREVASADELADMARLAALIKHLPLTLDAPRPIDEAISTAGGVRFDALTEDLMLKTLPGVFCAGEMLDWEAPTGGYLLTACIASGRHAALGALRWLESASSGKELS